MASGVPVIISKTKGFWDNKNFKNQKHIIFCEDNSISEWKKALLISVLFSSWLILGVFGECGGGCGGGGKGDGCGGGG